MTADYPASTARGASIDRLKAYRCEGRVPIELTWADLAFADIRSADFANPAEVSEARVGLYEVEGIRNFGALRNDGANWPDGAVVVPVRDARPGECEKR